MYLVSLIGIITCFVVNILYSKCFIIALNHLFFEKWRLHFVGAIAHVYRNLNMFNKTLGL